MKIVNSSNLSGGGVRFLTGLSNQQATSQNSSTVPMQMTFLPTSSNGVAQGYQILFAANSGLSFQPVGSSSALQVVQNKTTGTESKTKTTTVSSSLDSPIAKTPSLNSQSSSLQIPNLNLINGITPASTSTVSVTPTIPKVVVSSANNSQSGKTSEGHNSTQPQRTDTRYTINSAPKTIPAPYAVNSAAKPLAAPLLSTPKPRAPPRIHKPKQQSPSIPQYGALVTLNSNLFTVANPVYSLPSSGSLPDFSKGPLKLDGLSRATVMPVYNSNVQPPQMPSAAPVSVPSTTPNTTPAHASTAPKIPSYSMNQPFGAPPGTVDPRSLLGPSVSRIPHFSPSATSPGKSSDRLKDHYPNRQISGSQGLLLQSSIPPRLPSNNNNFNAGQSYSRSQYSVEQQRLPTVIGLRPEQPRGGGGLHLQRFQNVPGPRLVHDQPGIRPGFQVYAHRGK